MLISLPNGKTISMSLDQFLDLTDSQFIEKISTSEGSYIANPFYSLGDSVEPEEFNAPLDRDVLRQLNVNIAPESEGD